MGPGGRSIPECQPIAHPVRRSLGLAGAGETAAGAGRHPSKSSTPITFSPNSAMVQGFYGMFLQREGKPADALAPFKGLPIWNRKTPPGRWRWAALPSKPATWLQHIGFYLHAVELAPDGCLPA